MQLIPIFKVGILNAWIFASCYFFLSYSIMLINRKAYVKLSKPPDMKLNRREKIIGYAASAITYIAFLYSIFLPFKLKTAWFYIGLFIFLSAVVLLITAGVNLITAPADRPATKGIYSYLRHPIYLSNTLALAGIGISTASWVILAAAVIFLILANMIAIYEESYCIKRYGDTYIEYLNKVSRWIGIASKQNLWSSLL